MKYGSDIIIDMSELCSVVTNDSHAQISRRISTDVKFGFNTKFLKSCDGISDLG